MLRVFLDDERKTPEGWRRTYTPAQTIALLKGGEVTEISLDHDLGDDDSGTGYDVILWIEEQVFCHGFVPPTMHVHSANSSARDKMNRAIKAIHSRRAWFVDLATGAHIVHGAPVVLLPAAVVRPHG